MHLIRLDEPAFLLAPLTKRVCIHIAVTDAFPRPAILTLGSRIPVILFISGSPISDVSYKTCRPSAWDNRDRSRDALVFLASLHLLGHTQQCLENGWYSTVLAHQIESGLYYRQALADKTTNFKTQLANPFREQAEETAADDSQTSVGGFLWVGKKGAGRSFCLHKHAWKLIDSIDGAKSSAIIYSIAETAKANNLNPFRYLEYVLTVLKDHQGDTNYSLIEELLPWSDQLPQICRSRTNERYQVLFNP